MNQCETIRCFLYAVLRHVLQIACSGAGTVVRPQMTNYELQFTFMHMVHSKLQGRLHVLALSFMGIYLIRHP
jgi:hypothetical protein